MLYIPFSTVPFHVGVSNSASFLIVCVSRSRPPHISAKTCRFRTPSRSSSSERATGHLLPGAAKRKSLATLPGLVYRDCLCEPHSFSCRVPILRGALVLSGLAVCSLEEHSGLWLFGRVCFTGAAAHLPARGTVHETIQDQVSASSQPRGS